MLGRGRFRARGDAIEVQPAYSETAYRVSLFGDEVESITHFDPLTGEVLGRLDDLDALPGHALRDVAADARARDRGDRAPSWRSGPRCSRTQGKLLEAHRLRQRTSTTSR